jgi:hypothetical protein
MNRIANFCFVIGCFAAFLGCGDGAKYRQNHPEKETSSALLQAGSKCNRNQCFARSDQRCYEKGAYFVRQSTQTAWVCLGNNVWKQLLKV